MFYQNISLKPYNTFGIDVKTNFFAEIAQVADLQGIIAAQKWQQMPKLILGGGSNLLFTRNFEGLVIKNNLMGIEKIAEDENYVWLKVGAGENWHQFVLYAIENNYGGIENLSLIYGTVGASPMQNIGAYGVEIKDVFDSLEAVSLENGEILHFNHKDCEFAYRHSIFKTKLKHKVVITYVTFRLTKRNHKFNISYGAISQTLENQGITKEIIANYSQNHTLNQPINIVNSLTEKSILQAISKAVIEIRQSKLPHPEIIGNAGSFFKNPEISITQFEKLKHNYPKIIFYPTDNQELIKIPAGWLIEQCGWKGKQIGNTGIHKEQALVIVNYGNATGAEVWNLAQEVQKSVLDKFGISLQMEVNIY
jgi:UDP-N-acetylmuramate dehydrogenase